MEHITFNKSELIINEYTFQMLTEKITNRILKERMDRMDITIDSITYANVKFTLLNENGTLILSYTTHPSEWNLNDMITTIELDELQERVGNGSVQWG